MWYPDRQITDIFEVVLFTDRYIFSQVLKFITNPKHTA